MAREYRHIKMYEKEIFELKEQGLSQRQIADKFGISYEKIHNFFKRHQKARLFQKFLKLFISLSF